MEALNIIMSFTAEEEHRRLWLPTDIDKQLLRVIADLKHDDEVCLKALQACVNLALDKVWVDRFCDLNVARRIFEYLMASVKPDQSSVRTDNAELKKVQLTEEGGQSDMYEIKPGQGNSIQFAVMLLCNISVTEKGQEHLLGGENPKTKGSIIENLSGMFTYFRHAEMFDFVSNILSNVSSLKAGRCWMIENSKNVLSPVFLLLQDPQVSQHRIKHMIATLRNCLFEYEKYEKDFIQMDVIEFLCRFLVREHGLTDASLPESFERLNNICKKEKYLKDVDVENTRNLLDCLVLLANNQVFLKLMDKKKIYELLEALKVKPFGESRDKIDVINA